MPICELIVTEILPSLKSIITQQLFNKGMNQQEISEILGISQTTVSHYLNNRRAKYSTEFKDDKKILALVNSTLSDLSNYNVQNMDALICMICRELKNTGQLCKFDKRAPQNCKKCIKESHSFAYR